VFSRHPDAAAKRLNRPLAYGVAKVDFGAPSSHGSICGTMHFSKSHGCIAAKGGQSI
jgi:hypothetical protein